MRSIKLGLIAITVAGLLGSLAAAGCSADGGSADLGDDDASATEPTAQLPPPSETDSGAKDVSTKDVDPPPPSPGDPCTKLGALATRRCGACGYQHATCRAEGDALEWSDYGPCEDEVPGGCVPGTTVTEACGNCGTVTKTCTQYCAYTGVCGGEPPASCKPSSIQYSTAGCTTPNTYTKRTCAASCTWGGFSACSAPNNPNKLTISDTLGQSVKTTYTLSSSEIGKRPDDVCSRAAVWHQDVPRVAVELQNPTSKRATVTVYTSQASGGPEELDTVLWIYKTPMPPHDDDSLLACDYGLMDWCEDTSPKDLCNNQVSDFRWAGIPAVEIPAGGAVLVYIAGFHQWVAGPFALNVRTDNLL